jgi:hypothetical protein
VGHRFDDERIVVRFSIRKRNFSSLHSVQTGSLADPASYPIDFGDFFTRIKWPGRETYH